MSTAAGLNTAMTKTTVLSRDAHEEPAFHELARWQQMQYKVPPPQTERASK